MDEDAQGGLQKVKWVNAARMQDSVNRLRSRSAIALSREEAIDLGWPESDNQSNVYLVRAGTVGPEGRSLPEITTKLDDRVELQAFPEGRGELVILTSTLSRSGFPYDLAALVQSERPISRVRVVCDWIS